MGTNLTCKQCTRSFNELTREKLCAFCYNKKFGKWSVDFGNNKDGKK